MSKVIKKISAALVVLVMTTSILVTSFAAQSISETHWAKEKILKWFDLGIIKGSGSGDLRPDDNITRAEVATIINNVFGFVSKSSLQFTDVKSNDWYADELLKAREAGYYNGYTGNISNASSFITREDTSVMLLKVFNLEDSESKEPSISFKDSSNISGYAITAVGKLSEEGIIKGYPDGNFLPKANITRAEFISIIDNLVKVLCNAPGTYASINAAGNVITNKPSVELSDFTVSGNLYLTEGISSGNVTLSKVSVSKFIFISGVKGNINIIDSELNSVIITAKNDITNILLSGKSKVNKLTINGSAKISAENGVKAILEVNSDNVTINGQKVQKGLVIVENGSFTQNISENETEIPASIATSTPTSIATSTPTTIPTSTPTGKKSSGSSSGSNSSNSRRTPASHSTPTLTPTPTSTAASTSTPAPTSTTDSTLTPTPTSSTDSTSTPSPTSTATPTSDSDELRIVSAYVDNLKEAVLKFNKPLTNFKEAQDVSNYYVGDTYFTEENYYNYRNIVLFAELSSDKTAVTLLLQDTLTQKYDILVKVKSDIGLSENVEVLIDNIEDNTAPRIVDVKAIGNSLIKVTYSEPVQNSNYISSYSIDNEPFDAYSPALSYNEKTVSIYLTTPLSLGTHKLIVSNNIRDYAFLPLENNEIEFTVIKDTTKPSATLNSSSPTKVVIDFSEEVEFMDMGNISTDTEAEIEGIELSEDDMSLTIYFSPLSPFPSSGGKITIKNLTDLSGNKADIVIDVPSELL